jgi:hypothetical protein
MIDDTIPLFSFPAIQGKKVTAAFDGERAERGEATLDEAASARLDAVRRRPGGVPVDGPRLSGARNGRRFGLSRPPFGGCRFIRLPATAVGRAADEARIFWTAWSRVEGKLNEARISRPAWFSVNRKLSRS